MALFISRATFIIDDQGILRQITINDCSVGRSVAEVRRSIRAMQTAAKLRECESTTDLTQSIQTSSSCYFS